MPDAPALDGAAGQGGVEADGKYLVRGDWHAAHGRNLPALQSVCAAAGPRAAAASPFPSPTTCTAGQRAAAASPSPHPYHQARTWTRAAAGQRAAASGRPWRAARWRWHAGPVRGGCPGAQGRGRRCSQLRPGRCRLGVRGRGRPPGRSRGRPLSRRGPAPAVGAYVRMCVCACVCVRVCAFCV